MKKLIYILLLLPFLMFGQIPDLLQASLQQAGGGCVPDPNQYWTTAAPFSDPNCNESAALDGAWIIENSSMTNITAESTGQYAGNYAYRFEYSAGSGLSGYVEIWLDGTTVGDTFTITVALKSTQASVNAGATGWLGCTGGPSSDYITADGTWQLKTYNITATATQVKCKFYTSPNNSGVAGDNLWIDSFSAIKTN